MWDANATHLSEGDRYFQKRSRPQTAPIHCSVPILNEITSKDTYKKRIQAKNTAKCMEPHSKVPGSALYPTTVDGGYGRRYDFVSNQKQFN